MTAKVILNPYAARWKSGTQRLEVETALANAGINYELVETSAPRDGIGLASRAYQDGFEPIIAAGGDGTINEVLNGILLAAGDAAQLPAFGVLPLGTANDVVDNLNLPKDLNAMAAAIASGVARKLDVCQVNESYFLNNAGLGLEPYVTTMQERLTKVSGIVRYLLATLIAISHNPQWRMKLTWEGGHYKGKVSLVSIGNMQRTGGIFYMTPHAVPTDGQLTFAFGYIPTRLKILSLLPKTMKAGEGNYVEHPAIREVHSPWLQVEVDPPTPAHADGELFTRGGNKFEYRVHEKRLPLLTGI
jgi:diacylglycerol kinase (ATP)